MPNCLRWLDAGAVLLNHFASLRQLVLVDHEDAGAKPAPKVRGPDRHGDPRSIQGNAQNSDVGFGTFEHLTFAEVSLRLNRHDGYFMNSTLTGAGTVDSPPVGASAPVDWSMRNTASVFVS